MDTRRFDIPFESLPATLPIFPLPGVLLLPRGRLPLNIFEPRYLAMTEEALRSGRLIGMVQPTHSDVKKPQPPIYPVGCAGRITQFSETDDGRLLITLTGVCRFTVRAECPFDQRGFRTVEPDWEPYRADFDSVETANLDRARLILGLKAYFKVHDLSANWNAIEATPDDRLVTSLAMICPFEANEKQALLEARTLSERADALIALIEMAVLQQNNGEGARH